MAWQVLCAATEVVADEVRECRLDDGTRTIAVRTQAGEVRVFQGVCPHQKRALADGDVEGDVLTCAAHMWEFDLESGEGINAALAGLTLYPSRVESDSVLVDASAVEPVALWS